MELEAVARKAEAIRRELCKVIVGMDSVLDQTVVALLAGGHILLEGPPGTAKTLLVRALSVAIRGEFHRIQFTPDLMPADIIGVNIFNPESLTFQFSAGPVFCDLLLADEINRAPAKTQSALLEAMQEGQVSVDREVHPLQPGLPHLRHPESDRIRRHVSLPEAQLDRFLFKIVAGYPQKPQEVEILNRYQAGFDASRLATFGIEPCTSVAGTGRDPHGGADGQRRGAAAGLHRLDHSRHAGAARADPRGQPAGGGHAAAGQQGPGRAAGARVRTPDDVRDLAAPVLRHRIVLNPEAEIEGMTADQCVARVLERIEVPRI